MRGGKHLLLLAAFVALARCQQKPAVSVSPPLKQIYSGDLIYLSCENGTSGNTVKWYLNEQPQNLTDKTWKIAVAGSQHTGRYRCESNGQKSDTVPITVLEYIPRASLTIETGHPVMESGSSVILQISNDDGLQGWRCWVYRGDKTNRIVLRLQNDSVSLSFQPRSLNVPETIFWCTDSTKEHRSNQIIIWTSGKKLALEMYPLPAVEGESLTLRCLIWGTDRITKTVFYKNDKVLSTSTSPTYKISDVTEFAEGKYKCNATFTYKANAYGPPYNDLSDNQDVFVQVITRRAVLSDNMGLSCSCPLCPPGVSYRWYHMTDDDAQPSVLKDHSQGHMMPEESGRYACRAVWSDGMSLRSNSHNYKSPIKTISLIVALGVIMVGILVVAVAFYLRYRKRSARAPIYEDVAMMSRDKGDDKYETLRKQRGGQAEDEYHTLQPEGQVQERTGGQYEPLKKEGMKEGVYHTVGTEGTTGGAGGYEALKKEGMKEGVYHTVGTEGATGGAGGYEALKKEGMKEGVYHTVGTEGATGGAGGYEALKKEGMKEGVYNTLETEGGYEALKKEGMKGGEYHTLGMEGATGGE